MILRGHIHDGVVVLEDPQALPEGTEVEVAPVKTAEPLVNDPLADLIGAAENLPPDAARNKRHYLYGQPKSD